MEKCSKKWTSSNTCDPYKPRMNIIIGSKNQTGVGTFSHDKAGSTVEEQSYQFFCKDYATNYSLILLYGCESRSGEMNPSRWKHMLREDAWHIIQRTHNEWICMATDHYYPRRTSETFIVNCQALQVIMVWPYLLSAKHHTSGYIIIIVYRPFSMLQ